MNLEPIILSEVSQKEKDKYCVLTHTQGIEKVGTNKPVCRAAKGHGQPHLLQTVSDTCEHVCTYAQSHLPCDPAEALLAATR